MNSCKVNGAMGTTNFWRSRPTDSTALASSRLTNLERPPPSSEPLFTHEDASHLMPNGGKRALAPRRDLDCAAAD